MDDRMKEINEFLIEGKQKPTFNYKKHIKDLEDIVKEIESNDEFNIKGTQTHTNMLKILKRMKQEYKDSKKA